ncbi:cytochrome P450 [Goodfellowiella coeruleoviolacea]|uniref:Cytochrome P450 n=1 Tax=Goodfellowiella coeruleoviolacea TaxID=334858 RepID=A0AAE3GCU1_9PSEU|nr:cytochrome P450 [Goodfellowiella coeruleoviolacea]MCP2163813.1 Cytochrome P450 [Goodfellowiella coeruleoviolacea]
MSLAHDLRTDLALLLTRATVWTHARLGDAGARVLSLHPDEDPYPDYERIRALGPVVTSRLGLRLTAAHRLCVEVLRDHTRFGTMPVSDLYPTDLGLRHDGAHAFVHPIEDSFLALNPPEHGRLRRLVAPLFGPRALRGHLPMIESVVAGHLDRVAESPRFDLIGEFAARVPIGVIAALLGVPESEREDFLRWGGVVAAALDGVRSPAQLRRMRAVLTQLAEFCAELVAHRGRHPGDDVVSLLVAATPDRPALARKDLFATVQLLLLAGFETTVNLIGNAVRLLLADERARRDFVSDPDSAEDLAEEVLRYQPPIHYTIRVTREPVELGGVPLPAATPLVVLLAAANRDPEVFAEPNRFQPDRANAREHLAFSSGAHYCLGAGLARLEGALALRALFQRLPGLRAAGPVRNRPSRNVRGPLVMPVAPR